MILMVINRLKEIYIDMQYENVLIITLQNTYTESSEFKLEILFMTS